MAEVTNSASLATQVLLVIQLRWQTYRNGLRSQTEKMHALGSIALAIFFSVVTLGGSFGVGFAAYSFAKLPSWGFLSMLLWGIFMLWQFVPVLASQVNPGFDGRNLLRFPIKFSAFFLMSAAYGLADPFALAGIVWHIAIGIGVSIARPDLRWWAVIALTVSVLMNLLFNRMMFTWLERVLAKRRTREIITVLFILFALGVQFSGLILQRWGPVIKTTIQTYASVWRVLPPGLAGIALELAATGDTRGASTTAGLLALYSLAFGGLFALRVHAQFTGEDLGESAAPAKRKPVAVRTQGRVPAAPVAPGERTSAIGPSFGLVSAPVAAIFAKEVKYLYRNSMLLMNIFMPLFFIVFVAMTSSMPSRHGGQPLGRISGSFAYPGAVAYLFLLVMNFSPNNLAYEGRGVERYFLSPITFRDVMLGKNLFHSALVIIESLLVLGLLSAMGHPPGLLIILATWAGLPFAALMHFGVGNWLSLQYPRKFEFGVRRQRPSGMTILISFGLLFAVMGTLSAIAAICIWLVGLWLLPIVYLALSATSVFAYRAMLNGIARQAITQRETLLEQLAR